MRAVVTGVDASAAMLAIAGRRVGDQPNVRLLEGEATKLPLRDASVDRAISVQVFEYLTGSRARTGCRPASLGSNRVDKNTRSCKSRPCHALIISVVIDYNELISRVNEPSVRGIGDVLLVPTSDIDDDEVWELHPPAGDPPVELGRDIRLTQELAGRQAEEIMDACEPRGKDFNPTRQLGCQYAFVRGLPADEYASSYAHWDHDEALLAAFTLSRLNLDNAYSTECAARLV